MGMAKNTMSDPKPEPTPEPEPRPDQPTRPEPERPSEDMNEAARAELQRTQA